MSKQSQRAGEHSQQFQAEGDITFAGVSAAEVVEIIRSEVPRVLGELTLAANAKAESRVNSLEARISAELGNRPDLFSAFGDPDFQFSLGDAGRAAASNDDEHTEQLLVDLLANRAKEGNAARVRLATSQAIRAADKLSLEALNGLTALWALSFLSGTSDEYPRQMTSVQLLADTLVGLPLPLDGGWVRDIDVLNLGRSHPGGVMTRTSYFKIMQHWFAADLVRGIDPSASLELIQAVTNEIPEIVAFMVSHPLKADFVRLAGSNEGDLLDLLPAGSADSTVLRELVGLNGYGSRDNTAMATLADVVLGQPSLAAVQEWWDRTPYLDLTVVGEVVGFVNARRHISFTGTETLTELLHPDTTS